MNRTCGTCTLCCKLLPVRELDKPAGERCEHQRHGKGCGIYGRHPVSCRLWSCRWLMGQDTANLQRPDRAHYVIDCMPDYVTFRDNETGELTKIPVLQIWIDPRYPDAHRDPELRRYLDERGAAEGYGALIRLNSRDAFTLWPPSVSSDGLWHEMTGEIEPEHKPLAAMVTHVA